MVQSSTSPDIQTQILHLADELKANYGKYDLMATDPKTDPVLIGTPKSFTAQGSIGMMNHLDSVPGVTIDQFKEYLTNHYYEEQLDLLTAIGDKKFPALSELGDFNGNKLIRYRVDPKMPLVKPRSILLAYYFIHVPEEKKFIFVQSDLGTDKVLGEYKKELGKDVMASQPLNYMEFKENDNGEVEMWHATAQNYNGYIPDFVMKGIIKRQAKMLSVIVDRIKNGKN